MDNDRKPPPNLINWKDSIATNIQFFKEQSDLLDDRFAPSQISAGALMTVMIMNHNMLTNQVALLDKRLEQIAQLLHDLKSPG